MRQSRNSHSHESGDCLCGSVVPAGMALGRKFHAWAAATVFGVHAPQIQTIRGSPTWCGLQSLTPPPPFEDNATQPISLSNS